MSKNSSSRSNLIANLLLGILALAVSIYVGVHFKSAWTGIITGFAFAIVQLLVEIRIAVKDLAPTDDPLIANYHRFEKDPCELFHRAASQKYSEALLFFEELSTGKIEVHSKTDIHDILTFIFREVKALKKIVATSHGELTEWSQAQSWATRTYLDDHEFAIRRGVVIEHIFIIGTEQELSIGKKAFEVNQRIGVTLRYALENRIGREDLVDGGNCMVFYGDKGSLLYALRATHDPDGEFIKAEIFRDQAHVEQFSRICSRIINVSSGLSLLNSRSASVGIEQ